MDLRRVTGPLCSSQRDHSESITFLLFTITGLFNWPSEDRWPSLACEGCQGPASVPNSPWKELDQS